MPGVVSIVVAIGAGLNYDLIPAVGQDYKVTEVGSSLWVGVAPLAVPQVQVGITDGVSTAWFRRTTLANPDTRGWAERPDWYISRQHYLRINNPGVAGENVAISAKIAKDYGPGGVSSVVSDVLVIPAAGFVDVIPAAGTDVCITDVGSDTWVGAPPAGLPNVQVDITDGASFGMIAHGADACGWDNFKVFINDTVYMRLTAAAAVVVCYSGFIAKDYGPNGVSEVASIAATVLAAPANVLTVRPAAGQELMITRIGSSAWVGVAPGALPDLSVAMTDGALAGIQPVLMQGTDGKGWFDFLEIYIDRTHWLLITDTGAAGAQIGVSAIITEA